MMRFILVAMIWLVCVGGVALYMHARDAFRDSAPARAAVAPESAAVRYDLELTLTFDAQPDPFALSGDSDRPAAVSVRINNRLAAELPEGIAPGMPWLQKNIEGVVVGTNELLMEATPPIEETRASHAVRVRLLESGHAVADRTFWSEGSLKLIDTLRFEISPEKSEAGHAD